MSVLIETSLGDLVIDIFWQEAPLAAKNFIKLCKMKFYHNSLFYDLQKNYLVRIIQTLKPRTSIYEMFEGSSAKYFKEELWKKCFNKIGLVGTANIGPDRCDSEFFITLTNQELVGLQGKHTIFGQVVEGIEILNKLNTIIVDEHNRPFYNIRVFHTHILEDPFDDLPGMIEPDLSPEPILHSEDRLDINDKMEILDDKDRTQEEILEETKKREMKTKAIVLEMLDDIPDADIKPPDNTLFVCKLNPITQERDLRVIFSRFGPIKNCDIIRDWKTGNSLQYAFIEFETPAACEEAYFKMENALIDERRIHVDFSQSVAHLWSSNKNKKMIESSETNGPTLKDNFQPQRSDKYAMIFPEYKSLKKKKGGHYKHNKSPRSNSRSREKVKKYKKYNNNDRSRSHSKHRGNEKKKKYAEPSNRSKHSSKSNHNQ